MHRRQRLIVSGILFLTLCIVALYAPVAYFSGMGFSFASFSILVLFPALAVYFAGLGLYFAGKKTSGVSRGQDGS